MPILHRRSTAKLITVMQEFVRSFKSGKMTETFAHFNLQLTFISQYVNQVSSGKNEFINENLAQHWISID